MRAVLVCFLFATSSIANTYTTSFPLAENPVSESGNWINGGVQGISWTNVRSQNNMAIGTVPGNAGGSAEFADSTAVLAGNWGSNQTASAKVVAPNPTGASGVFEEVELRLRTTITANSITGYECNASVTTSGNYMQIVRWNGPLGSWTELDGRNVQVRDGDIISASAVGNVITTYLNGKAVFSVTDSMFPGGSPGIGFYLQGATGVNANYGLTNFSASDSGGSPTPTPSATPTPAPTPSPTPTVTPTPSPTPKPTSTPRPRPTPPRWWWPF